MAMETSNAGIMGLFGGGSYGAKDPTMNVPLSSNAVASQLSPYLSVDPAYLSQDEYIPLEGNQHRRGRFELAFSQIGGLVMVGGGIGGMQGFYKGLQETTGHVGTIRRTQVLNYVSKRVSGTANTLGSVAVLYSALGCLLYWGRGSKEDSANTLLAGSLTGAIFQSPMGLRKAGIGGAVGLAMAGAFVAFTSRNKNEYDSSRY